METKNISCPHCQHPIPVVISLLLSGQKFTCSNCQATISMTQESSTVVERAYVKYASLKKNNKNKKW